MITEPSNWDEIQCHFTNKSKSTIYVASLPKVKKDKDKMQAGVEIPAWWEYCEQKSIVLALKYQYMFETDITDCYGSIYTHTIPWSLYGKTYCKEHRQDNSLGCEIDHYMCAMNYNQTNGIPQGSVLFDLIAEIVLAYADSNFYDKLVEKGINEDEYYVLRYRDDYRIFANNKNRLEEIVKTLQEVLIDLNFRMNSSKTHLSEEVVKNSIKVDKRDYLKTAPIYKGEDPLFTTIQKELFFVLLFAGDHPNSGTVARLLSSLLNRIGKEDLSGENMLVLISITVEIMVTSPRVFNVGMALISFFLDKIDSGKAEIVKDVYRKLRRMPNTGEMDIWLQRIAFHLNDVDIKYEEPLTRIVQGYETSIWNNEWLKPELTEGFPLKSICDTEKRDAQTPIIEVEEVRIFEY